MTVYATYYGQRPRDAEGEKVDATGITQGDAQSTAAGTITLGAAGLYFVSCDAAHRVRFNTGAGAGAANTGDYWPSGWAQMKLLPEGAKIVVG